MKFNADLQAKVNAVRESFYVASRHRFVGDLIGAGVLGFMLGMVFGLAL